MGLEDWKIFPKSGDPWFGAGYYVYVSVDGTTWPDEDTGFLATWQDEFTTTYTMDCTLTASLGGGEISVFFGLRVW